MTTKPEIMSPKVHWQTVVLVFLFSLLSQILVAQREPLSFWDSPDTLHRGRFWTAAGVGAASYAGTLISLNGLWYNQYPRTSFHLFNDGQEWMQLDKAGHMYTAYFESEWCYRIARWTGMKRGAGIWTGALVATGLQATIETLDGFSSEWGFSLYDFAFNLAGVSLWASQQAAWDEQRIRMKMSTTYQQYPETIIAGSDGTVTTLRARARDLFGKNILQTFLKDYNAQTIWLSVNVHSFLQEESRFPKWLNVAIGYSAQNMFGGFKNEWKEGDATFSLSAEAFPRYRQWYLSPDLDLSKIKTNSKLVHTLLCMANIFKVPAPAIEWNGKGGVKWKWLHY